MSPAARETDVVVLSGVRTGFGGFGGSLKDLSATQLGTLAATEALARSGVAASDVSHVVFGPGWVKSSGLSGLYIRRPTGF